MLTLKKVLSVRNFFEQVREVPEPTFPLNAAIGFCRSALSAATEHGIPCFRGDIFSPVEAVDEQMWYNPTYTATHRQDNTYSTSCPHSLVLACLACVLHVYYNAHFPFKYFFLTCGFESLPSHQ